MTGALHARKHRSIAPTDTGTPSRCRSRIFSAAVRHVVVMAKNWKTALAKAKPRVINEYVRTYVRTYARACNRDQADLRCKHVSHDIGVQAWIKGVVMHFCSYLCFHIRALSCIVGMKQLLRRRFIPYHGSAALRWVGKSSYSKCCMSAPTSR